MVPQGLYEDRLRHLQDDIEKKQRLVDRLRRTLSVYAPTTAADDCDDDYESSTVANARH